MTNWFNEIIWKPIKTKVILIILLSGIGLIVLGVFIPLDWLSKLSLHIGSAALGGGVFAVILKSAQFTEIFQKHIATVFFNPNKIDDEALLRERWLVLSDSLLQSALPVSYESASARIYEQFFNKERDYHFENYNTEFDIKVGSDGKMEVHQLTRTNLFISPHASSPTLIQDLSLNQHESAEIGHLFINGKAEDNDGKPFKDYYETSTDGEGNSFYKLQLPLINCIPRGTSIENTCLEFERKTITCQKIDSEPYIFINISRYIKGAKIKARVTEGYDVKFNYSKFGRQDEKVGKLDSDNFKRWELAQKDELILPGKAYILYIVSKDLVPSNTKPEQPAKEKL